MDQEKCEDKFSFTKSSKRILIVIVSVFMVVSDACVEAKWPTTDS